MGAVLQGAGSWFLPGQWLTATLIALTLVIAISYGFELFSKFTGIGRYDFMDAVASVIGGVTGMGIIMLLVALL